MKFSLSTNWCSDRIESAAEIAEKALSLGFDELELGFRINSSQAEGFRRISRDVAIGSVHAFCPVPISAPSAHPELYSLATLDENAASIARFHVIRSVEFASSVGADVVVLHAGRVPCEGLFRRKSLSKRRRGGEKVLDAFRKTLELLVPVLEVNRVRLGLENLPYFEGFPDEMEMASLCGEWVQPWLDTGHDYVRHLNGWKVDAIEKLQPIGMHLNDSKGGDDHLAPGDGDIDFSVYKESALKCNHLVLEPNSSVTEEELIKALGFLRNVFFALSAGSAFAGSKSPFGSGGEVNLKKQFKKRFGLSMREWRKGTE